MLALGHMGITIAIVRAVESRVKMSWVDYRLMLVASVLPDLIDKPIGYLFFAHPFVNGRVYGHSILFVLFLSILALVYWYYKKSLRILILCIGSAIHYILDQMWYYPKTLFWPVYGWAFSQPIHDEWAGAISVANFTIQKIAAFEMIGGSILIYFFIRLVLNNQVKQFCKTGQLSGNDLTGRMDD